MTDNLVTNNEGPENDHSIPEERENVHVEDLQNIKIYYAEQIEDRDDYPLTEGSLANLIETIRSDESLGKKIDAIRAIQEGDKNKEKKKRSELKKSTLPYFTLGKFKDDRATNENFVRTKHIVINADQVGDLEATRKKIVEDPTTFVCFRSPGGDGLKTIFELDREITDPDQYEAAYTACLVDFEKKLSLKADHTIDPARACFISHDTDIFVNENRQQIHVNSHSGRSN